MPVDFSVKRVPDAVARRLRERAERHHRSLQRELLSILESAAAEDRPGRVAEPAVRPYVSAAAPKLIASARRSGDRLTLDQLWDRARRLGGPVPDEPASTIIRRDRDERSRH